MRLYLIILLVEVLMWERNGNLAIDIVEKTIVRKGFGAITVF